MKIIAIVFIIGVLVFLTIVGIQVYKTLCMNFIFDGHWPEDTTESEQTEKPKAMESFNIRSKKKDLSAALADQL